MKPSMSGIIQIAFMEWGILSLLLIYPDIQPSLLVSFSLVVLHLNTLPLFIRGSSLTCHYLVTDIAEMNQSCGSVVEISQISLHDAHRTYCVIVLLKVFHDQSSLCDAHRTYCVIVLLKVFHDQSSLCDAHRTYCVIVLLKVFHDQSSLCDAHRTYCK